VAVKLRKLALDLSDGVGRVCIFRADCIAVFVLATQLTGCSAAPSGQAPTPHSGAPKARGLTARTRTERTSVLSVAMSDIIGHCPRDRASIFTLKSPEGQWQRERSGRGLVFTGLWTGIGSDESTIS
jgi:hypothetical protein